MAFGQGTNVSVLVGFENGFGVLPTPKDAYLIPAINPAIRATRSKFESAALTGSAQPRSPRFGKRMAEGTVRIEANKRSLAPMLKGLFGTVSDTGTTGFYSHRYTLGTQPPMFVEQRHSDVPAYFLGQGLYLGGATFDFPTEGLMEMEFRAMGKDFIPYSSEQITGGTITDLTGEDAFAYTLARIVLNGTTIGYSQNVSFTVDRKLGPIKAQDESYGLAGVFSEIPAITGHADFHFSSLSMFTLADNATESSLEVFLPAGLGHGLWVQCPTVIFDLATPTLSGTGLVTAPADFSAYARGTASDIAAEVRSMYFTSLALNGLTIIVSVSGGANQTVTFAPGDDTPLEAQVALTAGLTGVTVTLERMGSSSGGTAETGASILIKTVAKGAAATLEVKAASTADVLMGFDNAVHTGLSGQAMVVTLINATATM